MTINGFVWYEFVIESEYKNVGYQRIIMYDEAMQLAQERAKQRLEKLR